MFQDLAISVAEWGLAHTLRLVDRAEDLRQGLGIPLAQARAALWGFQAFLTMRRMPDDPEEAITFLSQMMGDDPSSALSTALSSGLRRAGA